MELCILLRAVALWNELVTIVEPLLKRLFCVLSLL